MMNRLTHTVPFRIRQLTPIYSALLLGACGDPAPGEGVDAPKTKEPDPQVVSVAEALNSANIPEVDLAILDEAEIATVVPAGPNCSFSYIKSAPPVLAATVPESGPGIGVIKIQGRLVQVTTQETDLKALAEGAVFEAQGVRLEVTPELSQGSGLDGGGNRWPADLIFELEQGLHVGYHGWYSCGNGET